MEMSKFIMLIAPLAVALTTTPARACGPHGGGACRPDLQTLCPNVTPGPGSFRSFRDCLQTLCQATPGPGAFASCLQEAATSKGVTLSDQCQAHLTKMQAKMDAWKTACGGAVTTYCSGITGPRDIGECLREHQSELSNTYPQCQALLAQHHGHRHHHGPADPNGGQ
ncbi:MAG: hypothetical protein ABSA52_01145 [Candidatus Binatia bacterium]